MNLCGIDEAGRGPIAGPLSVAGVMFKSEVKGLNDSKVLSEKKREALFDVIKENSYYHIVLTDAKTIDEKGLSACIKNSIKEIMQNIKTSSYLMDGNTAFGISNLTYKIKADATVPEVSAASILAKVTRDRLMCELASSYPEYNFEKHKGYGTKAHVEAIKKHGYCEIHRRSFKLKALEDLNQESLFD
jgi:ribonuclease HII